VPICFLTEPFNPRRAKNPYTRVPETPPLRTRAGFSFWRMARPWALPPVGHRAEREFNEEDQQ